MPNDARFGTRYIVVPLRDNAGKPLTGEKRQIEQALCTLAGGFTRVSISGAWRSARGTIMRDISHRYEVYCDDATDKALVALLPAWCALLRQESLYTEWRATQVAFVSPLPTPVLAGMEVAS